jgi:hypothetical protein
VVFYRPIAILSGPKAEDSTVLSHDNIVSAPASDGQYFRSIGDLKNFSAQALLHARKSYK